MGDNDFNQYSSASHWLFANLIWRLLSDSAAMYSGLSRSAEISPSRQLEKTSADWKVRFTFLPVDSGCQFAVAPLNRVLDFRRARSMKPQRTNSSPYFKLLFDRNRHGVARHSTARNRQCVIAGFYFVRKLDVELVRSDKARRLPGVGYNDRFAVNKG